MMSAARCAELRGLLLKEVLGGVNAVLLDCDGVLWRGGEEVRGASQAVRRLQESGREVLFLTNNSSRTRRSHLLKMQGLGFQVREEEVFSSAYCSALYLQKYVQAQTKAQVQKQTETQAQGPLVRDKVYLVGTEAMAQELEAVGVRHTGVGPDPLVGQQGDWANVPLDPEVGAVLVGFDPHFSYMKLNRAMQYLQDPACLFLATNTDSRLPLEAGKAVPGTGCLVKAVEMAAQREAHKVGKPNQFMVDCAVQKFGLDLSRCLMVGDRLDTDILLGANCGGLRTLLTLTGVTTLAEALAHRDSGCPERQKLVPDFYVESIADLLPALEE